MESVRQLINSENGSNLWQIQPEAFEWCDAADTGFVGRDFGRESVLNWTLRTEIQRDEE
jgi:hypothetical protein